MDGEGLRLALGTFLSSPGFGGLMTGAGILAGVRTASADRREADRARVDARRDADAADERDRWWHMVSWLDANAEELDAAATLAMWEQLDRLATTRGQGAMMEAINRKIRSVWSHPSSADEFTREEGGGSGDDVESGAG